MITWPAKAPEEIEKYAFDWTEALAGAAIEGLPTIVAEGVTSSDPVVVGNLVEVLLSEGTAGTTATVTCTLTTDGGETLSEAAILVIDQEPVSLDMAKRQCRAEGTTDDDVYLLELLQAAQGYVESYCGIRLAQATVQMTFPSFCALERLTQAPVQSIVDVHYLDANGAEQLLDPSAYEFLEVEADPLRPKIRAAFGAKWPSVRAAIDDAVRVNAVIGYQIAPRPVVRAILALVTHWYDNRLPVAVDVRGIPTEIEHTISALLTNSRR